MTAPTTAVDMPTPEERAALGPRRVLMDIWLVAERNTRRTMRNTGLIVFSTIQPLMQLILFAYVFTAVATVGGGVSYQDYVVPAVIVQAIVFASMSTGVGLAYDLESGIVDRFRVLPIARSAYLLGRALSDGVRLTIQALLLVGAALVIGFRFETGLPGAIGMVAVIVLFGVAMTVFSSYVGLRVGDPEAVQPALFIPVLPLVFTSSAFAPVSELPSWMQPIAEINPVTATIDTARGLALGADVLYRVEGVRLEHAAAQFAIEWLLIVVVFTWLAVRRYRKG